MNKYLAVFGKPRFLGILSSETELKKGTQIVVESVRGEDIAIILGTLTEEQETKYRALQNTIDRGENIPKITEPAVTNLRYLRMAGTAELNEQANARAEENNILKKTKEIEAPHNLGIKITDVELLPNRQKLFVYFASEQRVDFRAYVRDLAREFRTRIELRQIGVRDEAKIVGGLGICGHRCCCSYWLHQFVPVGVKMVKEQNLALNPTKISGICGRLMCCMCYEHNVYSELWEGLPAPGSKIAAAEGSVTISGIDLGTKALKCYIPGLGEKNVAIDKFEEFKTAVEAGKTTAELEEIITDKEKYNFDALDMNIFKDSSKTNSKNVNAGIQEEQRGQKKRFGYHRAQNGENHQNGSPRQWQTEDNAEDAQENGERKKYFRNHRRGGKKHHPRYNSGDREE